jgi:hypothetical protein
MSSSGLIRWGGLAAMVAGLAFILDILAGLGFTSDNLFTFRMLYADWTNAVYIVAVLLMVVGLLGLHTLQKDNYGRIGRGGFWTVVVASLAQVLGLILFLLDTFALLGLVFPVGVLAIPVGLILYGVATLQAKVLPRWCGLGLIIIPPITLVSGYYGGILFGVLWLALGYVLWTWRGTAAEQPSRVR